MDVRLAAGWDGLETTERIWREDPHVQIVLCTAYSTYSWRDLIERFPGSDRLVILKKPFDAVEALQLATALSEKWQLEQEARRRMADLEKTIGDQEQNRALAEAQFSAVLAERNRMAREIHDTLAQGFAAIFVQLEVVKDTLSQDPEAARKHVERAGELARQSLEQARRTIWNIRSRALEVADLPGALAEIGKLLTVDTSAQFSLKVTGLVQRLSDLVENNLLRIGQEAITNAMKHSDARAVSARLEFRDDSVCLEIRDDGAGVGAPLQDAERPGGFGLPGEWEGASQRNAGGINDQKPIRRGYARLRHRPASILTMKAPKTIRVLVVDDHPALREGLAAILDRQPDMRAIAEAAERRSSSGSRARPSPRRDSDGPPTAKDEWVGRHKSHHQRIPGGAHHRPHDVRRRFEDIYRALQAGARAYLLKDMGKECYLEAIRSVNAGKRWIPPARRRAAGRTPEGIATAASPHRETEVLRLVTQGVRATRNFPLRFRFREETAKTHLQSIFAKLGVKDRTAAAIAALRQGIVHLE